jgi:hypothetical protein
MRTALGSAIQSKYNSKWAITLESYNSDKHGREYVSFRIESAPVFTTEDEAYEGGKRALETLETTGMYPNMCEAF